MNMNWIVFLILINAIAAAFVEGIYFYDRYDNEIDFWGFDTDTDSFPLRLLLSHFSCILSFM